jgi:hypothetical protein
VVAALAHARVNACSSSTVALKQNSDCTTIICIALPQRFRALCLLSMSKNDQLSIMANQAMLPDIYWFGTEAAVALVAQHGSCASKISR